MSNSSLCCLWPVSVRTHSFHFPHNFPNSRPCLGKCENNENKLFFYESCISTLYCFLLHASFYFLHSILDSGYPDMTFVIRYVMSSLRYDSLNSNICNLYCLFLTLCILYVSSTHAPNICCPILNDFYLPLTKDFKSHFCNHHMMGLNLDMSE